MIMTSVPQPVWQLGHGDGSLIVIVGVTVHFGFLHGILISFVSRTMHSGCGPHVVGLK
jgi:hypothetical protein